MTDRVKDLEINLIRLAWPEKRPGQMAPEARALWANQALARLQALRRLWGLTGGSEVPDDGRHEDPGPEPFLDTDALACPVPRAPMAAAITELHGGDEPQRGEDASAGMGSVEASPLRNCWTCGHDRGGICQNEEGAADWYYDQELDGQSMPLALALARVRTLEPD